MSRGGDIVLFALSLGVLMGLFERAPGSVTGGTVRKTMAWIGGRGWVDPVPGADEMRQGGGGGDAALSRTTTTTSTSYEDVSTGSEEGSVVLDASIGSSSGEDIGEGVRILDEEMVKSPGGI
jgi:hypothetical protein